MMLRRVLRRIAPNMGRCDLTTLSQNLRANTLVGEISKALSVNAVNNMRAIDACVDRG